MSVIAIGRVYSTRQNEALMRDGMTPFPAGRWHRLRPQYKTVTECGWKPRAFTRGDGALWRNRLLDDEKPPQNACQRCWDDG